MRSSERHAPSLSVPERIGRYELLLPIGTGGMATVYLAQTRVVADLYRNVALKLMHPHLRTEDGSWAVQLVEEAKLAASIRHPNVVPVLEVGDDAHGVFLVMEYVEGDTLAGVIRAARAQKVAVPPPIAARILSDALTGLHAAHELTGPGGESLQLVHRDFSPQNLLVGTDGISRLTDFGIAKVKTRVGVTASGVIKGKIGYMAPEQALGRPLDRRCDVWAAGVVAWELLAMRRLYQEDDQVATLLRLVSNPPPRIRSVCPDVPQEVDDAIASALQVDPAQRCENALELRRRLLEAWSRISPVADTVEVSEYVRGLVASKLDKRREQVQSVIALREKISDVSERAIEMAAADGFDSGSIPEMGASHAPAGAARPPSDAPTARLPVPATMDGEAEATTDQSSSWSQSRSAKPWKRPVVGVFAIAIAVLLVGSLVVWQAKLGESTQADRGSNESTSSAAAAAAPSPAPVESISADPSATTHQQPPERAVLVVRSDVPMTGLQLGHRTVALVTPTREVDVQLTAQERAAPLELTATAKDGRRATAKVPPGETAWVLQFPAPSRGRPPSTAKPTAKKPPGLAPTPYEK